MKARNLLTMITTTVAVALFSFVSGAQQSTALFGTAGGGGGNPIQDLVKTRINEILENAKTMTANPAQKAIFDAANFDPFDVSRIINSPPQFQPLCASGAVLADIQRKQKAAYVYDTNPKVINLDCQTYPIEKWTAWRNSTADWTAEFFLHEALRVAQKIQEDNDNMSSSYTKALRLDPSYENDVRSHVMANLIDGRYPNCKIEITSNRHIGMCGGIDWCGKVQILFKYKGVTKIPVTTDGGGSKSEEFEDFRELLTSRDDLSKLTGSGYRDVARSFIEQAYQLFRSLDCEQ